MENHILFHVENGAGWITLNRPKAVNSLSVSMVEELGSRLAEWKQDDSVRIVCIEGAGEKGLCAGGDMRSLYDKKDSGVEKYAKAFFETEYRMNAALHHFPKPVLAYMNGIVMGGGMGIAMPASERIVTEKSRIAMPEMNIGFFPDVGASYFLNKMPGYTGRYLALTAGSITAGDVLYLGAADHFMESRRWAELSQAIRACNWQEAGDNPTATLREIIAQYAAPAPESLLAPHQADIDKHFTYESVGRILDSLDGAAEEGNEWAHQTASAIKTKSPVSLAVALEQLIRGEKMALGDCFRMELNMSLNFMRSHDFYEGVRSVLVDKDRNPKWEPASLENVKIEDIEAFFSDPWKGRLHPLHDL
ncbi:enoyl-CoA hydratase/isomerase family protein [Aneurinibacillus sp. Ricciae_BoGa-3]|uniref:enoyl-CoA hydratase/isomerase family protein n=1 Tax=Aneurinibacillus sp. Ricciae_BoGa-3 TaxID=3022697 RepID=UPI002341DEDA|nr:enoyl-CoA hydratase/isomerase family protein [Aneurinibacillus sp. Ricciae_BoGa-3]WCK52408.1 enoyl-CoA hydratase/isomerase family protein [Aneurinibacillus sp. Ricciae_BoGa-3]